MLRTRQDCATAPRLGSGCPEGTLGAALSEIQVERYSRQIILPQVGGRGQLALLAATVAMCGSSELATTAALYLAGAGIGHLCVSPPTAAAIEGLNPDCHVVVLTSLLAKVAYAIRDHDSARLHVAHCREAALCDGPPHCYAAVLLELHRLIDSQAVA